jgi:hypothetical protein
MIDIQKKQFEDWWDTQWMRFDSDRETINSRKSCAKDGFDFGLSTVWNEIERLKKELELRADLTAATKVTGTIGDTEYSGEAPVSYRTDTTAPTSFRVGKPAPLEFPGGDKDDLSAPVGFSREQMRDIFCEGAITRGDMAECDRYLDTLTPAAKPYGADGVGLSHADVSELITHATIVRDHVLPRIDADFPGFNQSNVNQVLVEALERIAGLDEINLSYRIIAREALAHYKGE